MTGLECLREELKKRGATKSLIESKAVAMTLDIVAQTPDGIYQKTQEAEARLKDLEKQIANANYNKRCIEAQADEAERQIAELNQDKQDIFTEVRDYVVEFNKSLNECETPKGRDLMRAAQMFVDTVDVNTKYDNTAFIIGLSAILSQGEVNAIGELKKINPKMAVPKPWYERDVVLQE